MKSPIDTHKVSEELKKAVTSVLLLLHPDFSVVFHGGQLRVSPLEPTGLSIHISMDLEMQPRTKKESPAE